MLFLGTLRVLVHECPPPDLFYELIYFDVFILIDLFRWIYFVNSPIASAVS